MARGDADEYSDIDLIVVKQTHQRFVQRMVEAGSFIPKGVSVDVFVYTPEELRAMINGENPFIEQALSDGKIIFEENPDNELREAMSRLGRSATKEGAFVKKNPQETARRWLAQSERSLRIARLLYDNSAWAEACFHAEQTAQLALKAFLFLQGRRFVNIHSVRTLAEECALEDTAFALFADYGTYLDRYYLSTRYPDALPAPAIPYESFTPEEASQALAYAEEIVAAVRDKVSAA
jgi:HEPN domain-containing protein